MKIDRRRKADHRIFAQKVIECNMDTKKAMQALCKPDMSLKALQSKHNEWIADAEVVKEISRAYENLNISTKDTKNILSAVLLQTVLKANTKDSDRIAGCLAQAKIAGLINESTNPVNILIQSTSEGLSRVLDGDNDGLTIDNTNNPNTTSDNNAGA